jgi:heme/copper-type cytochrome/quinol oxidase subunit 2
MQARTGAAGRDEGAVAALVLALAGYIALPVIPAVMAVVTGLRARRRIRATPGLRGERMAVAAVVLAVAELVLAVLIIVGLIWFPLLVPGG